MTASEPISTACFINPSHKSVSLYVCHPLVARQRHGKKFTMVTKICATIEELLDLSFSIRSVSYQKKVGDKFFSEFRFQNKESRLTKANLS
jgi:hypothetical protein